MTHKIVAADRSLSVCGELHEIQRPTCDFVNTSNFADEDPDNADGVNLYKITKGRGIFLKN